MSRSQQDLSEEKGRLNIKSPKGFTVHIIDEDSVANPFVDEEKTLCGTPLEDDWQAGFTMMENKKFKRCKKCEARYLSRIE